MYSEGVSSANSLMSDVTDSGYGEQSSWTRLRRQVMDMIQTVTELPTSAPVTDQVLHSVLLLII